MKRFAGYFLGTLLIILALGCNSQQVETPQQIINTPTVTVLTTTAATPTAPPLAITVENASSLKLQKIIGSGKVNDVAWSPLGEMIAVAQDFDISFYDSASLQLIGNIGFGGTEVVFSPDGLFVAIVKETDIIVWDIERKISTQELKIGMARINHVMYNSDGTYLAVLGDSSITGGDPEYVLEVWDVDLGKKVISNEGYDSDANITFSLDGETLAFVNVSGLTLIRIETGKQQTVDLPWENGSLAYISDNILLKRLDYSQLKVIDLGTFEILNLISVNNGFYSEFKVSPDKQKIVFPAVWDEEKYLWITQVWDLETESLLYTLDFHSDVTRIDFSPDSKYFISADYDGYIRIHDLQTGETANQMEFTTQVEDVEFLSDSNKEISIVAGYLGGQVRVWNLENEKTVKEFVGTPYWGNTISVSPDQKFIITQSDSSSSSGSSVASVWNVETGDLYRTINCPDKKTLYKASIANDGDSVVADCDGLIMIWNLESLELTASINGVMLERIPDGNRLVALTKLRSHAGFFVADIPEIEVVDVFGKTPLFKVSLDKELYYLNITDVALSSDAGVIALVVNNAATLVWSADSNARKYSFAGHDSMCFEGGCAGVQDVAFSPYGYLLASAGYDNTVRLWDAESGIQIVVLDDLFAPVNSVAFSPDGHYLIAGCDDGRIYVWAIE